MQYKESRLIVLNIGPVGASKERRILVQRPLISTVFLQCVSFLYPVLIALTYKRDKQKKLKATCFFSGWRLIGNDPSDKVMVSGISN